MSGPAAPQPGPSADPVVEIAEALVKALVLAVVVLAGLPLLLPLLLVMVLRPAVATKTRFWLVPPGWPLVVAAGIAGTVAVLAMEALHLPGALQQLAAGSGGLAGRVSAGWAAVGPWLGVNLALGLLLLPAAWAMRRRRIAGLVQHRRVTDVVVQERIESARKHAADLLAARTIGVRLDPATGKVRSIAARAAFSPLKVGEQMALGIVTRPTIRTTADRLRDRRQVRDWISAGGRWVQLPADPGAVRAMVVAESGSGKTVLLHGLIESALTTGWPVVVIDGKGDPADAELLARRVTADGRTATVAPGWNLFAGSGPQIVEKLMRLLPPADGANQHYLDEARAALTAVQAHRPLTSTVDLQQRLTDPIGHVRDAVDLELVTAVVEPRIGLTAGRRVARTLSAALRPLEHALDPAGWSYRRLVHDVTIVPLTAADTAQARLGDLLLLDLRHALADRLATGDRRPLLVVVDEFAQLVGPDTDPGDTAAALFETARSAGLGLVLAAQSTAGISGDDTRRARALASGAALIIGRSKDPEDAVRYAGTVMRMESSGAAAGEELRSARAQHSWVIPPQDVREAWDGAFWLIQAGAIAAFRALPTRSLPAATAEPATAEPAAADTARRPVPPPAAEPMASPAALALPAVAGPAAPIPRMTRPAGGRTRPAGDRTRPTDGRTRPTDGRTHTAVPTAVLDTEATAAPVASTTTGPITGLEIDVRHLGDHHWVAIAYPATDELILNDVTDPVTAVFTSDRHPQQAQFGAWADQWHPTFFTRWNDGYEPLPTSWSVVLNELVDVARHRYHL